MTKKVYIFRGGPASGKSTLSQLFCEQLDKPVALIEQDRMRWGFHVIGRDISEISEAEHRFANRNAMMLFEEYLKNGDYTIVIEGLFTLDDPASSQGSTYEYKWVVEKYGYQPVMILLKADKNELWSRNQTREYSVPEDEFNRLYENVYRKCGDDEMLIDSTGQSTEDTLRSLRSLN